MIVVRDSFHLVGLNLRGEACAQKVSANSCGASLPNVHVGLIGQWKPAEVAAFSGRATRKQRDTRCDETAQYVKAVRKTIQSDYIGWRGIAEAVARPNEAFPADQDRTSWIAGPGHLACASDG